MIANEVSRKALDARTKCEVVGCLLLVLFAFALALRAPVPASAPDAPGVETPWPRASTETRLALAAEGKHCA